MVQFQASGGAVLGNRTRIPHRAVTLSLSLGEAAPSPDPGPLADMGKESVNIRMLWALRVELPGPLTQRTSKRLREGEEVAWSHSKEGLDWNSELQTLSPGPPCFSHGRCSGSGDQK